jgi:hypothetical protein
MLAPERGGVGMSVPVRKGRRKKQGAGARFRPVADNDEETDDDL